MKSTHAAAVLCLLAMFFAVPATAATSFSGFYLDAGIGYKSTTADLSASGGGVSGSFSPGDHSFFGQLQGGYSFAFTPEFRLAIGAFYDIGDGKAGSMSASGGGASFSASIKETERYGVSIEP